MNHRLHPARGPAPRRSRWPGRTTVWPSALVWVAAWMTLSMQPLVASPICRWVDGHGRTQFGDVVPEAYRQVAVCTDSRKYEITAEQQREAEEDRAALMREAAKPASAPASGASGSPGAAAKKAVKQPAEAVTDTTDCGTWWRLYDESSACFGPFRTVRGGLKVEAFDACNVVASPELRCGPRRR